MYWQKRYQSWPGGFKTDSQLQESMREVFLEGDLWRLGLNIRSSRRRRITVKDWPALADAPKLDEFTSICLSLCRVIVYQKLIMIAEI